jgi:hypothetical protein
MTNDERNDVIRAVNASLHGLPEAIRSISADYEPGLLRLQFIHDGELDEPVRVAIDTIEERVASVLPGTRIVSDVLRIDAPGLYSDRLLPIVILAMFEQNEEHAH